MTLPTLEDIRAAAARIHDAVERTWTTESLTLGRVTGARIVLKFENLQFTASFKERGALNKLMSLTAEERMRGVIAVSAGNHAQGVAYNASRLGIPATIVMPKSTPFVKVENTAVFGAEVVLEGANFSEASDYAAQLQKERNLVFVHPYDDPYVVAGQGTIALEMLEDTPLPLDVVVVPIGGGGMISGMATAIKALAPHIRVVGVQAALYPGMDRVIRGEPPAGGGDTIAEGIAVKEPGHLTRQIVARTVDEILTVDEDALETAITHLLSIEKTVVEGAGAAALAAVLAHPDKFHGKTVGVVLSGGNIDQRLLAGVIMRHQVRSGRMGRLRIALMDMPGQLAKVTALIGQLGGNIIDVSHQRIFSSLPAKDTTLEVALETIDARRMGLLIDGLRGAGYVVEVLDGPLRGQP